MNRARRQEDAGHGAAPEPRRVTLYGKPGCHLCDDAEAALGRLGTELPLSVTKLDITTDSETYERFRYRIPVVTVDGDVLAEGKVTEFRLRVACAERGWLDR